MIDDIINDKSENTRKANQLRIFLLTLANTYNDARNEMGITLNQEALDTVIRNMVINFEPKAKRNTTGTFSVTHSKMTVIKENFENNDSKRNIFLLNHELTHLSSPLNVEISDNKESMQNEYDKMLEGRNNQHISGFDAIMGAVAVDEVLAQWCCENCNDFLKNGNAKRRKKLIPFTIMDEYLIANTDFSNNDIYSPLQQYVENFSSRLGFEDFHSFANCILTGEKRLNDLVTPNTVEQLGYIGILCEGIYQDNKFNNFNLPKTDIPIALDYLDSLRKTSSLPAGPDVNQK